MRLVLYSKPGCHLCEGLQEKLDQVQSLTIELEVRNILTCEDWWQAYQYDIPVLCKVEDNSDASAMIETRLPRLSPRASVERLTQMLQTYA